MTVRDQYEVAEQTKEFIDKWGLKKKYVAATCSIPEVVFSSFINGRLALSERQISRIVEYTTDYVRRNS